jgi:CBS domain-containing protein
MTRGAWHRGPASIVKPNQEICMNIGNLCSRHIVTIDSERSLASAAGLMRQHHVGSLVVTTDTLEGSRVAGVVTDRDLVVHVLALGLESSQVSIGDMAHHQVVSVFEDDDITQAIQVMREAGVRRLLVSDAESRLVGVVSLDDLLDACAAQMLGLAGVIRSGIDRETAETSDTPPQGPLLRVTTRLAGTSQVETGQPQP